VESLEQRPIQERTLRDPTIGVRYHNEQLDRITFSKADAAASPEQRSVARMGCGGCPSLGQVDVAVRLS